MDQSSEHTTNRAGHILNDHKFEPFDRVLVRVHINDRWTPDILLCTDGNETRPFVCTGRMSYRFCIPYTPETAHLLGTSEPYEPPKPPHEYKWGDRVEVAVDGKWMPAVFMEDDCSDDKPICVVLKRLCEVIYVERENLRPLEPSHE